MREVIFAQARLVLTAIQQLERLGRGYNSGYAEVQVKELQLLRRKRTKSLEWDEKREKFSIKEVLEEESLKKEVLEALEAWKNYLENR